MELQLQRRIKLKNPYPSESLRAIVQAKQIPGSVIAVYHKDLVSGKTIRSAYYSPSRLHVLKKPELIHEIFDSASSKDDRDTELHLIFRTEIIVNTN